MVSTYLLRVPLKLSTCFKTEQITRFFWLSNTPLNRNIIHTAWFSVFGPSHIYVVQSVITCNYNYASLLLCIAMAIYNINIIHFEDGRLSSQQIETRTVYSMGQHGACDHST